MANAYSKMSNVPGKIVYTDRFNSSNVYLLQLWSTCDGEFVCPLLPMWEKMTSSQALRTLGFCSLILGVLPNELRTFTGLDMKEELMPCVYPLVSGAWTSLPHRPQ